MSKKDKPSLRVAVTVPVKETFSYALPDALADRAEVGVRVLVPFKKRKVVGYVLEKGPANVEKPLKEICDVLDPEPLFPPHLVPFFQWMADYYFYPVGRLIQSVLPGGLNANSYKTGSITEKGLRALKFLPPRSDEANLLSWIKGNPGKRLTSPLHLAQTLEKKGWVTIETKTSQRRVGPLMKKFVRAKEGFDLQGLLESEGKDLRAKNELEFLEALLETEGLMLEELSSRFDNGPYLVNKWIERGALEKYSAPVFRNPSGKVMFSAPVPSQLFDQQKSVLEVIQSRLKARTFSTCLLFGVTGSGKTEVYYQAVEQAIRLGRQSLLMVPEIALAVYMESIFRSRLGDKVAIYHSGLSTGERYDQWIRMVRGEVDLVIGARSALFAPLPRVGLIIVDEEYDSSYKQEEAPRYQARDCAVVRGRMEKALVILGSGTPSVQSYYHTVTGKYQLLRMPERIEKRPLPDVQVVDLKMASAGEKKSGIISPMLQRALEQNLEEGKQAILFLNRRGFNRVYLCGSCGEAVRCPNCDLALIYHLTGHRLACHYCGFHSEPKKRCPGCGYETMKARGFGTERLEKELKEILPQARIARLDRDTTRKKGYIFSILKQFSEQQIDIMVGTQLITKGYDFPNVTLVGVIIADLSLGVPDFRAGERTFQLLSQVAGRAGRGEQSGRVIVQAFNPEHYAIRTARDHDYSTFFKTETELREQLGYPPFSYMACLRFMGNSEKSTAEGAQVVGRRITGVLENWPKRGREIQVLGPAEAPLAKLKGKYRWQILLKSKGTGLLHYLLKETEKFSKKLLRRTGVTMIIDVDPYQML